MARDSLNMATASRQLLRRLLHFRPSVSSLAPCHRSSSVRGYSGPFSGALYNVRSSWQPHGALKEHQDALPCQPVPPLAQTMARFLESVRPLLDDKEYARAVQLTGEFSRPGGEGHRLQTLLEERAGSTQNWLADWWIKAAYLGYRDPVCVYVNPSFVADPMPQYRDRDGRIRSAAIAIAAVLKHKVNVDNQTVPIERIGQTPQCMIQYYHILGVTRIPGVSVDHVVCHQPEDANAPRHVTVICNSHIFHVDVYDDAGRPLSVSQIQTQLENVVSQSLTRGAGVGTLTSDNRDGWYQNYTELSKDPQNVAHLSSIQRSLFVLSLDERVPGYSADRHYDVMCPAHFTGGGHSVNGANRWLDKTFQLVHNHDGVFGFTYEHSVAEGPPVLGILQAILEALEKPPAETPVATGTIAAPQRLDFNLTDELTQAITQIGGNTDRLYQKVATKRYLFSGYGRDFAKSLKLSPDGFIQVHMQLAYYMLYGHLVSTYESGSLRKFRLGRTDTIRSVSIPAHNWCKAMVDPQIAASEKLQLLRTAVDHHRWYTNQVVEGQAVDRHLLGLKLTAADHGLDTPAFLADPIYTQSVHWGLSTTTVPLSNGIVMFGPVVQDGYGIYYNAKRSEVDFGITTWAECEKTDVHRMAESLEKAFMATYELAGTTAKL